MNTQLTNLEPEARASQLLSFDETKAELTDLAKQSERITQITNKAGRDECHSSLMVLKNRRIEIEKRGKEARDDANKFAKAVIAKEKELIGVISPEEERLQLLRDQYDSKLELERLEKIEAERQRIEAIRQKIQSIRDMPSSLVGKPSVIIAGQLAKLEAEVLDEDEFAEHFVTARDALDAAIARVKQQLIDQQAHEAEQKRIAAERAELEKLRAEAEARRIADEERAAAERTEADRKAQAERDRIAAEERAREESERAERERLEAIERGKQMEAAAAERDRLAAERKKAEAELEAERNRQIEVQRKLDEQAEQLRKEKAAAAKKAEAERLANLGLREAAITVVNYFQSDDFKLTGGIVPRCVVDLDVALANDAAQAKPAKKAAA